MTLKFVNGEAVPMESPCPADCWHEAKGWKHRAYQWYEAPGTNWLPRLYYAEDAPFLARSGWVPR